MSTQGKPEIPGKGDRPDPNEKLVTIFDSEQESEVMVVRGLLESAGIESLTRSLDAPQDILPVGGVALLVREEQAEEARKLIEEYRASASQELDTQTDISEEPA